MLETPQTHKGGEQSVTLERFLSFRKLENTGPDGKNLTQRRLKSLLQSSRTHKPEKATQVIHQALEELWKNEGERDDATFLMVDWAGAKD
jgi:hypothetical protein